jgi:tetrahydromethanopterin S-methyltransferase subunit G
MPVEDREFGRLEQKLDDLQKTVEQGFTEVTELQRKTNGRVGKLELKYSFLAGGLALLSFVVSLGIPFLLKFLQ